MKLPEPIRLALLCLGVAFAPSCAPLHPRVAAADARVSTVRLPPGAASPRPICIGRPGESQPESGRGIGSLRSFQGRVYTGYGDWTGNTGPILVVAYDPASHRFDSGPTLSTEAIDEMRVIGGRLVIPEVDSSALLWTHGDVHFFDGKEWSSVRLPRAVHVFDVAEFGGKLHVAYQHNASYFSGSRHRIATLDGDRLDDPKTLEQSRRGRIYRLVALGERLYAFPDSGPLAYVFDGKAWHTWGERTLPRHYVFRAETDGRRALVLLHSFTWSTFALVIDEAGKPGWTGAFQDPIDVKVADGMFYVLERRARGEAEILRSGDLAKWESVLRFESDSPPTALETLDGSFYVGLENGELWRLPRQ